MDSTGVRCRSFVTDFLEVLRMGWPFFEMIFGSGSRQREEAVVTGRELYIPRLAERLLDEALRALPAPLAKAMPDVHDWVQDLVVRNRARSTGIPAPIRAALEGYYPREVLDRTHVVVQRQCPSIPLAKLG